MNDMINSINDAAPFARTISMNLCNVQKGTLVDEMFERGDYRPPWLWSAVEALKVRKRIIPGNGHNVRPGGRRLNARPP